MIYPYRGRGSGGKPGLWMALGISAALSLLVAKMFDLIR